MNAARRETVRISALRHIASARTVGLGLRVLLQLLKADMFRELTLEELDAEVQYLAGKGLVEKATKILSPENSVWRVTAAGRDFLAEQGQDE